MNTNYPTKADVQINGITHVVHVGYTESLNKKIQLLVGKLGYRFSEVEICVPNFPNAGRQLVKKSGSKQIISVSTAFS